LENRLRVSPHSGFFVEFISFGVPAKYLDKRRPTLWGQVVEKAKKRKQPSKRSWGNVRKAKRLTLKSSYNRGGSLK
jgi:hypothetical protein